MSNLKPRRARTNAFDTSRTDRDEATPPPPTPLGALLEKVAPAPVARGRAAVPRTPRPAQPAPVSPAPSRAATDPKPAVLRGAGGRATAVSTRMILAAARIPMEIYDGSVGLVKGVGKPSWAQLIAATCRTRRDEVVAEALEMLRASETGVRGPNRAGEAKTQISPRYTPAEHEAYTAAIEAAQAAAATTDLHIPVTASSVTAAALLVASRQPT